MRFEYTLYPEARKKLESAGIISRIEEANKENMLDFMGTVYDDQIPSVVEEMKSEDWFAQIPKDERKSFGLAMNKAFKNRDSAEWIVKKPSREYREKVEPEDFLLLLGDKSRAVLSKQELFDYNRFGFENITSFTGAVGVAIHNATMFLWREGFSWETKRDDGRTLLHKITGSEHGDLRIHQTDLTPYETFDFIGNRVPFRPLLSEDENTVSGYHSTEGALLASILKYVNQLQLDVPSLENRAEKTIAWVKSLGQGGGSCAEHFGGFDQHPMMFFHSYDFPLPVLDADFKTKERTIDCICTQSREDGQYYLFVGPSKELIISYEKSPLSGVSDKNKVVSFMPDEIDSVIRGLFYQCAKGLGRTSAHQMVDILSYRLSPEFNRDMQRIRTKIS